MCKSSSPEESPGLEAGPPQLDGATATADLRSGAYVVSPIGARLPSSTVTLVGPPSLRDFNPVRSFDSRQCRNGELGSPYPIHGGSCLDWGDQWMALLIAVQPPAKAYKLGPMTSSLNLGSTSSLT